MLKPLSGFPVRHELVKVLEKTFSLGGAVSNVARDLARLDPELSVEAVGAIGRDGEGDLIIRELSAYANIDLTYVTREGQTSFTDVLYEPETKARTFLVFGGAGDKFDVENVPLDKLNCSILHAGYILLLPALDAPDPEYGTRMARLLHDAQARGIQTSVDVVSEVGDRYRTIVPPALRYTDYFIVNEIEAGKTGFPGQHRGGELLIEQCAAGAQLIQLGRGFDDGGGAFPVRALHRADALGQGHAGFAAVRGGAGDRAEIHMAGGGQHFHPVLAADGGGPAVDQLIDDLEHTHDQAVGPVVVIAVFGGLVEEHLPLSLMAFEVVCQDLQHPVHGQGLVFKDMLFQGAEAVGDGA